MTITHVPAGADRAAQLAATGAHHVAVTGTPPARQRIAHAVHALLPDLDLDTAVRVAELHRAVRVLPLDGPMPGRPSLHTADPGVRVTALIGGRHGPGLVSLAHAGVLLIDPAPDLPDRSVQALRTVLDDGRVTIHSATDRATYPAWFHLVLGSPGCPANRLNDCDCRPAEHRRYHAGLTLLLDRIDLRLAVSDPVDAAPPSGPPDTARAVADARQRGADRWKRLGHARAANGRVASSALSASLRRTPASLLAPLRSQVERGRFSPRGALGVLRLAWTIADLDGHERPTPADVAEAIAWRTNPF